MPKPKPKKLRPDQNTICPGFRCRGIVQAGRWLCPRCWHRLPPLRADAVRRSAGYVRQQDDAMSRMLLEAAKRDALRELEEVHRECA